MAEEIVTPAPVPEKGPEPQVDPKVLAEQIEQIKKAQAGSDRAYQEEVKKAAALAAELENLKKEKMTEAQKAQFEFEKQKQELEAKSREVAEATLRLSKDRLLSSKNVPLEFSEYISGTTEAELAKSLDTFNKLIDKEVAKRVEEKLVGGPKPKAAEPGQKSEDMTGKSLAEIEAAIRAARK